MPSLAEWDADVQRQTATNAWSMFLNTVRRAQAYAADVPAVPSPSGAPVTAPARVTRWLIVAAVVAIGAALIVAFWRKR